MSIKNDAKHPDENVRRKALVALADENDARKRETTDLREKIEALEHLIADSQRRQDQAAREREELSNRTGRSGRG